MKRILTAMALAMTFVACSGEASYTISGKTSAEDGLCVNLVNLLTGETLDSAIVNGGAFAFKGKAEKDALLYIIEDESEWMTMFFNDGKPVTIDLVDTVLTASPLNEKLFSYDRAISAKDQEMRKKKDKLIKVLIPGFFSFLKSLPYLACARPQLRHA